MYGPGKFYDLPGLRLDRQPSLSALVEFPHPVSPSAVLAVTGLLANDHVTMQPRLPVLYRPGSFHPHFLPVLLCPTSGQTDVMAHDPDGLAALLDGLATGSGATGQVRLNFPVRSETVDAAFPASLAALTPDPEVDALKPLVIVAIIDHGIAFAHRALRSAASTRVEFCWSQSAEANQAGSVLFGREFRRAAINAMLASHGGDEEAIYRAAGLMGRPGLPPMPLARKHSHGAHVLGSLAGNWPADAAAQVRIIAVDLPATAVWDTSGFGTDMFLLSALHYIFDRAEKIAAAYGRPEVALVVNLSYGISGGPQDGSGLIGAAFDELIADRRTRAPTALILPAGNLFQDGLHASITDGHFTPDPGTTTRSASLTWRAPPADRTSSFIELWYPPGTRPAQIRVSLTPPRGIASDSSLTIGPGAGRRDMLVAGRIVGQLQIDKYRGRRWRVTIILAPTEPRSLPPAPHGGLPAGYWTITLHRPASPALTGAIDCRIQRDTSYGQGNTGAQQSCFVDPGYDRYAADGALAQSDSSDPAVKIRRFGGLNGLADGATALIVSGYVASTAAAARYSSAGPAAPTPPLANHVTLSAMTDRAPFHPGVRSAGTRSGVTIAQRGTSSAAPQVARELARCLLTGAPFGPTTDNYLALLAASPACTPVTLPGPGPTGQDRLGQFRLAPPPQA